MQSSWALKSNKYINRELSWLEFNKRVLSLCVSPAHPLKAQMDFLAITASNLDEFFMIRVASVCDQVQAGYDAADESGMTPKQQLSVLLSAAREFMLKQYEIYAQHILPSLEENGLKILSYEQLSAEQRAFVATYYDAQISPVLTPMAVDASRPFPLVLSRSLNLALSLKAIPSEDNLEYADEEDVSFATVQAPTCLARTIELSPSEYIMLEEIIRSQAHRLFEGFQILSCAAYSVTRNADLEYDEEEATDLLDSIEKKLKERKWGAAIRLEVEASMDQRVLSELCEDLEVEPDNIIRIDGPINLCCLRMLAGKLPPSLKYAPFTPKPCGVILPDEGMFTAISRGDILLHHPFDSFEPVVDFILQAARDPNVLAIKQTLYRVSSHSPIVDALAEAAESGKQVTALLELKARFDEENNIHWGKRLERAGCHVIYGLAGLKTHSKITLIVRREGGKIRRYLHLATGNYNDVTARIYTDFSLFTADNVLNEDATLFFNMLSGFTAPPKMKRLVCAPSRLRKELLARIRRETDAGKSGRIYAKMNSLVDSEIIDALYKASNAGVHVRLLVRGICCLRPNIKGLSENIEVRSIVGRFLEHSRIFTFGAGDAPDVLLSSADWMPRNLNTRVELMFPVLNDALRMRIMDILDAYWRDNQGSFVMQIDGSYTARESAEAEKPFSVQGYFMKTRRM